MTTDYRALCAELLQAWDDLPWEYDFKGDPVGPFAGIDDTPFERARAALAQLEPAADGEVAELVALIRQIALAWEPDASCLLGNKTAGQLARAADLLERLAQPVGVNLKRAALSALSRADKDALTNPLTGEVVALRTILSKDQSNTIRRALEALPDD